jgi:methionyl-tRNA formyltransferase
VAFAGTPEFAATALRAIHAAGHALPWVLTQPDRPAGRGLKLNTSPVKQLAQSLGITVAQPRSLRLDGKYPDDAVAARAALASPPADVVVVAAYGLILPQWVLTYAPLGCLNIHASLLPRWRGAAPIQRAIEAGDTQTGITLMQMDEGLDTGAMIDRQALPIGLDATAARLHDALAALGAQMIVRALARAATGSLPSEPQPADGVSYAHKIDKAESAIDWALPAAVIERRVRAFDPFPGASMACRAELVKVWAARVRPDVSAAPGRVVWADAGRLTLACGQGGLDLLQLQRPGGKRQPVDAYLQAQPGLMGADLAAGPHGPGRIELGASGRI